MIPKDVIKNTIDMAHRILTTYLSDLSDEDLMVRAVPGANHISWQLGHLIASENKMMSDAGFDMPKLPDGFAEAYTKETSTSDDRAKFHSKEQYLKWLDEQRTGTLALLDKTSESDMGKATPEAMHAYAPTVSAAFNMIGIHVLMHVGQFVPVRRKLDKPVLI